MVEFRHRTSGLLGTTTKALLLMGVALTTGRAVAQANDADAVAQGSVRCSLTNLASAPAWSVKAQRDVGAATRQASDCLGRGDSVCAETALAAIQSTTLSDDERGLVALPRAELATLRNDHAAAVGIYEDALTASSLNASLRRDIALRLAIVRSRRGELAAALRTLDANVACDRLTADTLTLRAGLYQGLGARAFALEHFEAAMVLYQLEGKAVPPTLKERHAKLAAEEAPKPREGTDLVPIFRSNPAYPQRALQNGISGWVQLEFDITDLGAVENVRVVKSSHESFDEPSIAALQRWRYVPKFENGLPVSRYGEQTVISFCLEPCNFRRNPPPQRGADGVWRVPETR